MFRINASRIRQLMFERKLSVTGLAKATNLNPFTARKIVTDGVTATGKVVGVIAEFFGVDGNEIILTNQKG